MDEAKRFELLSNIMRASHFEWRRAMVKMNPTADPVEIIKRYWEEVGKDTAQFYLRKIDPDGDLPQQLAELFVASSVAMGEDAKLLEKTTDGKSQAQHHGCPWFDWHKRENLLDEDIAGCDHWLKTVVDEINAKLGVSLQFETVESLPCGGKTCLRQFWEDKA